MNALDRGVYEYFSHLAYFPAIESSMLALSWLGSYRGYLLLVPIALCLLLLCGLRARVPHFLGALLGAELLELGIKEIVGRQRPPGPYADLGPSFPSGHALVSLVFFGMIAFLLTRKTSRGRLRTATWILAGLGIASISLSRLYLSAHWATDVIGGLVIGGIWLGVCVRVIETCGRNA